MVCIKNLRRLCCRVTKYGCILFVCALSAVLTSQLSQNVLFNREASSSERVGVRLTFSLTSVFQNEGNVDSGPDKQKRGGKNKENLNAVKTTDVKLNRNIDLLKRERNVYSDGDQVSPERHIDVKTNSLMRTYNVTPNTAWLKTFYNINKAAKRKSIFDFPFIIDGSTICAKSGDPYLVIIVLSVHTHIDTREAIRTTWGRAAKPGVWPKIGVLKETVKLLFLFGKGKTRLKNTIVRDESNTYRDVVQADFVDSYFNLSYKVITGIRWVSQFCPNAKYILKADEDVFVHVPNLINMLKEVPTKDSDMFYGHTHDHASVLRTGRWEVSPESFPFPFYPSYTCGNTYIVPGLRAAEIYNMAGHLDYMNIEDVFVTGILRTLIGAGVRHVVGFTNWYEKKPKPCEFKNNIRISATRVTEELQRDIWEGLKSNSKNCYQAVEKKKNISRPEHVIQYKPVIRDEHIYFNKSDSKFYSIG